MTKIIKQLFLLLPIFVVSCSNSKKEPEKSKYDIQKEQQANLDTLNLKEGEKISNSHNAIVGWDTAEKFTFYLQELFENSSRPISFIGEIKDIIKKDSNYILKVMNSNSLSYKRFNAEISVAPSMFQELKSQLQLKTDYQGCFIFQVKKISSSQPILNSEIDSNGDNVEDASSYITFDFDETLIKFQGKLIAYYLYAQLKKHED